MSSTSLDAKFIDEIELGQRLNRVIKRLRTTFHFSRWTDQAEFEKDFQNGILFARVELTRLEESFILTKQILWYERDKRKKKTPRQAGRAGRSVSKED